MKLFAPDYIDPHTFASLNVNIIFRPQFMGGCFNCTQPNCDWKGKPITRMEVLRGYKDMYCKIWRGDVI